MATTRQTLKDYFKKYATPTEAQFAALIDSFVHKDEDSLTQSKIDGLTAALNDKVSTQDLGTAVATAVAETLQGGNIEITPAAHEHAVSDISGLGARLTTLETSKADYEAFKTLVTAFLNDADVSDTTINRWKELEDFLAGITDSDTLAGMLQALKAEILAEVPQPQTGNYLEQVTDMAAALQTAEVGKIVQYVGQSDAEYTRGLCYENKGKTGWDNFKLPAYSFDNCTVKQVGYVDMPDTTRSLFPSTGAEVIADNNIHIPKLARISCSGDEAYALYWDADLVEPAQYQYYPKIGDYVLSALFNPIDGKQSQKFDYFDGKIFYYAPDDTLDVTNELEFLDVVADNIFITEYDTLNLFVNIPNSPFILSFRAYTGIYCAPGCSVRTITDLSTTENYNGEMIVKKYNIGGWQPIVTSPVVS